MPDVLSAIANGTDEKGGGVRFHPSQIDPVRIEGRPEKSLLGKVRKLVDDFLDRALDVVRVWMAEGR